MAKPRNGWTVWYDQWEERYADQPDEEMQPVPYEHLVFWGERFRQILMLNDHWIGPSHKYLCGNQLTIADYFGAGITTAGELIHCDFSAYPNIKRWLDTFKAGPNYDKVYETFTGFCASTKGQPWQAI